jgi:hypothetical protein
MLTDVQKDARYWKLGRSPYFLLQLIVVGKKFCGLVYPSRQMTIQAGNRRKLSFERLIFIFGNDCD